jgi:hypothetical protein
MRGPARRRGAAALLGALLLLAAGPSAGAEAAGASRSVAKDAGPCPGSTGVTVVVDFGAEGGTSVRCAPGSPRSGFDALREAGFTITPVSTNPGFLCRIDGVPADDDCRRVPPASRYWAYFSASRGGAWSYEDTGGSRRPAAGSVEGWSFGDGAPPRTPPPAAAPAAAAPTTSRPPAASPTTAPPSPRQTIGPDVAVPAPPSETPEDGAPVAPAGEVAVDATTTTDAARPDSSSSGGKDAEIRELAAAAATEPERRGESGSPMAVVVGVAIVLALVASAAVRARASRMDR